MKKVWNISMNQKYMTWKAHPCHPDATFNLKLILVFKKISNAFIIDDYLKFYVLYSEAYIKTYS